MYIFYKKKSNTNLKIICFSSFFRNYKSFPSIISVAHTTQLFCAVVSSLHLFDQSWEDGYRAGRMDTWRSQVFAAIKVEAHDEKNKYIDE